MDPAIGLFGLLGGLGTIGIMIFIFLVIVMPICIYAAQKWAYKCFKELQAINKKLDQLPSINSLQVTE